MGALAVLLLSAVPVLVPQWHVAGPPFPIVTAIATAPDLPNLVYAVAWDHHHSALFRSDDGGFHWVLVIEAPVGEGIGSVEFDPQSSSRLFATFFGGSTPETYVDVSEDGGRSWQQKAHFENACGGSFVFGVRSTDSVYLSLGCSNALWASPDHGETWIPRVSPTTDLFGLDAGPDGSLYASSYAEIFRSQDGALSWDLVASAPAACPSISAFAANGGGNVLMVGTGIDTLQGLICGGIYRSEDRGRSWSLVQDRTVVGSFVRDPRSPSRIYAAARYDDGLFSPEGDIYQSDDGGRTWKSLALPIATGASQVTLSFEGRRVYAATYGGVYIFPRRRPVTVEPR